MEDKRCGSCAAGCRIENMEKRIEALENYPACGIFCCRAVSPGGNPVTGVKCATSLQKGELVFLFFILMEGGIWFFDAADKKKNRSQFQSFIERNFTYLGEAGRQHDIAGASRHFSECSGFTYRDKQLRCLDRFMALLANRREKLGAE